LILVFIAALSQVGVQTASPFAVVGAAMVQRDQRVLEAPQPRVIVVEQAKTEIESAGIEALQPQQVVRVIPPDSDPSRLLSTAQH